MPKKLWYCDSCGDYTIHDEKCNRCGGEVRTPHPAKFSPVDKYQKYRIPLFKEKFNKILENH